MLRAVEQEYEMSEQQMREAQGVVAPGAGRSALRGMPPSSGASASSLGKPTMPQSG